MAPWGYPKSLVRMLSKKSKSEKYYGDSPTAPCVASVTKELAETSGRVPPEARADLAMTQVRLTRRSVPDEDPEQTLLLWLSTRGFHDVLALRTDARFDLKKRKGEGLDLCLWVDPARLLRAGINKDPTKPPKRSKDLSNEERASLVQAATSVLEEAKDKKMLSYKEMFLLHEHTTLGRLVRLQGSYRMFWDRGDVLLDAIAAYFGTKIGFYFAWLKFYTVALLYPTLVGLLVWWTERGDICEAGEDCTRDTVVGQQSCMPGQDSSSCGVSSRPWWQRHVSAAVSLADVAVTSAGGGGGGGGDNTGVERHSGLPAVAAGWQLSTSLAPYFNVFLAVWATLFLVLWKRRSHTLAFRWGVHKEGRLVRRTSVSCKAYLYGRKRNG